MRSSGEKALEVMCAQCEYNPEFRAELYGEEDDEELAPYFLQLLEFKNFIDSGINIQNYLTYEQWQELALINSEIEIQKAKKFNKKK